MSRIPAMQSGKPAAYGRTIRPQTAPWTSPWTRPPEKPSIYRAHTRLTDIVHGWLDGRNGIPSIPADPRDFRDQPDSGPEHSVNDAQVDWPTLGADRSTNLGQGLWTPRMEVLVRQARESIETERLRFTDDWATLQQRLTDYQNTVASRQERAAELAELLATAKQPPSDADLSQRRLAEQDVGSRPDRLVQDRRRTEWGRHLATIQQLHQAALADLAQAIGNCGLQQELISGRAAAARAAARRHHELAMRRIATYLQQLCRTHRHGRELNSLLTEYRVGPKLPAWAREPEPGKSGVEEILRGETKPSDRRHHRGSR
jgi:hypothetical protein